MECYLCKKLINREVITNDYWMYRSFGLKIQYKTKDGLKLIVACMPCAFHHFKDQLTSEQVDKILAIQRIYVGPMPRMSDKLPALTHDERKALKKKQGNRCYVCNHKLHIDVCVDGIWKSSSPYYRRNDDGKSISWIILCRKCKDEFAKSIKHTLHIVN